MPTREQLYMAIENEQNAIAFYEQLKTLTEDEKQIKALNKVITQSHQRLRDCEGQYEARYGELLSPPLEKLRGRAFSAALRRAWNAVRFA
jgi:rubrerythrin